MEDENGIELSLGLSCGGSASRSKTKDGGSDVKAEEGGNSKLVGGNSNVGEVTFKRFLQRGTEKPDPVRQQKSDFGTEQQENFWTDLGKCSIPEVNSSADMHRNSSQFPRYQELWATNNRAVEVLEEKSDQHEIGGKLWQEAGNKRKMSFEEINHQKKNGREVDHSDTLGKNSMAAALVKSSHVSLTTEDGSSAENEDVAESEAEGSTSRLVSQHENSGKQFKDKKGFTDSILKDAQGQKQSNAAGNESNLERGNFTYGVPCPIQPLNVMTSPYSIPVKVSSAASESNTSVFPVPCVMQLMPSANGERPVIPAMNPSNFQLAFGYSPVQLPTLETDSTWGAGSHPQQFAAYVSRSLADGIPNTDQSGDTINISQALAQEPHNLPEGLSYERKASELARGGSKQHATEETGMSSSSQAENDTKANSNIYRPKEISDQPAIEGFAHEVSAIRPGIAAGLKFGGCGSYPDLPWVSATGSGPNGKTISGVTYRYSKNQIRIVCACHGFHMSPDEFIQHASADVPNPENNAGFGSFPSNNPAASAQS
eukprot:TRINITY_DN20140_c0_g1_i1.p1 TRINITY_DN20140_c0_g1~~TRINITY_DN20140_c0_g1_i1.p1  ORF type:complete len:542 (-),score=110.02 TRINITY_DN20140_c0_g1_i1:182-1807(-)